MAKFRRVRHMMTIGDLEFLPFLVCSVCTSDNVCLNKQSHLVQRGISFLNKPLNSIKRDIAEPGKINSKNLLSTREKMDFSSSQRKGCL
jgi:hypothetical protein